MKDHIMSLPRAEYDALIETVTKHLEVIEILKLKHRAERLKLEEDLHNSYKGIVIIHTPDPHTPYRYRTNTVEMRKSSEELDNLLVLLVRDRTEKLEKELLKLETYKCNVKNILSTSYAGVLRQNAKRIKELKEL